MRKIKKVFGLSKNIISIMIMTGIILSLAACGRASSPQPQGPDKLVPTPGVTHEQDEAASSSDITQIQDEPGISSNTTQEQDEPATPSATGRIILATTTSTADSGLLDYIVPEFENETGLDVDIISVGTGTAIQMGKDGEADVLLVHDTASEEAFIAENYGIYRKQVMYNDFILVGDPGDPAEIVATSSSDIVGSLKAIAESESNFVSRSDDSGTHKLELRLWKSAEIEPQSDWYIEAGAGMGDCLKIANELKGYTISDRATYLNLKDTLELTIVCENDALLFNQYGVLVVNPDRDGLEDKINRAGAEIFAEWITGDRGQALINEYGTDKFGAPLFVGNAE